jgi:hypothetical protein
MTTQDRHHERVDLPVRARAPAVGSSHGILGRWLRRTANRARKPERATCRHALLHDRAAAVHDELLEIAATLQRAEEPDPASIADLHRLPASGWDSPLYNPDIHPSELRATLHALRTGFANNTDTAAVDPQPRQP